jgi:hypothetical protein
MAWRFFIRGFFTLQGRYGLTEVTGRLSRFFRFVRAERGKKRDAKKTFENQTLLNSEPIG